ncbi:MAG: hypothetical protein RLZZ451_1996 [Pseudomonadota bacterium]
MPAAMAPAPQPSLFDDANAPAVQPAAPDAALQGLAARLHARWGGRLHLGTSSWHFPGWAGQVWARPAAEALLSRTGLAAYARHPLLRAVSLDRAFYRLLAQDEYAALAAQVPEHFRFVVKAPALLTDAQRRDPATAAPLGDNPGFLDAALAASGVAAPAALGLGAKLGVLVLQLSPLPPRWLRDPAALHDRLAAAVQAAQQALAPHSPGALVAVELRDPALLTPGLAALLRRLGARHALGLHDRMPPVDAQLPMLRATWPGDLVCRWNLQRGQRYAQARDAWAPFDRLRAPDEPTRQALARVARATLDAGHRVFITINNKAEGSAPASVRTLAEALDAPPGA